MPDERKGCRTHLPGFERKQELQRSPAQVEERGASAAHCGECRNEPGAAQGQSISAEGRCWRSD